MKRVLVIGNYGVGNLGDDCLALATVKGLRADYPCVSPALLLPPTADFDSFPLKDLADLPCANLFPAGVRGMLCSLLNGQLLKTLRIIRSSDIVVFGGGGLFNAEEAASIRIWGLQALAAKLFQKPVVMLGQSVPEANLHKWRLVTRFFLNLASLIVVRDPISFKVVTELVAKNVPVKEATDLAFSLDFSANSDSDGYEETKNEREYLLVNFRYYKSLPAAGLEAFALKIVRAFLDHTKLDVKFIAMDRADKKFFQSLKTRLPSENRFELMEAQNYNEFKLIYSRASAVVSMRLHGLILGILAGRPTLSLSYNDKNRGIVEQFGLKDQEIDLKRVLRFKGDLDLDSQNLVHNFCLNLTQKNNSINHKKYRDLIAKSRLNFTYCKKWLN